MGKRARVIRQTKARHEKALEQYYETVQVEASAHAERLSDDRFAESLGLPIALPDETRRILGMASAVDVTSDKVPTSDKPPPRNWSGSNRSVARKVARENRRYGIY